VQRFLKENSEPHTGARPSVRLCVGLKHACAVKLSAVAAEVLAVAADAVLAAHHLSKLGAHLVTTLARLHVHNFARINSQKARSTRKKRGGV